MLPRSEEILTLMPGPAVGDSAAGFSWPIGSKHATNPSRRMIRLVMSVRAVFNVC